MPDTPASLANNLARNIGRADVLSWLEDQLATCDNEGQARRWCEITDAVEAGARP